MELGAINSPAAAFVAGLITSIHCAGMCGPLACSLVPMTPARPDAAGADVPTIITAYHVSRLAGYATLGAAGGALGRLPLLWLTQPALRWLPWIMVLFFVGLALRWDRFVPKPAVLGRCTWKLQAWSRRRSRITAAAALGVATPLLPCGPLYFVLTLALLAGSAARGVEFMLAFGAGTVPVLWVAQSQFHWVRQKLSPTGLGRLRAALGLSAALIVAWRLRATLGFVGPDATTFICH